MDNKDVIAKENMLSKEMMEKIKNKAQKNDEGDEAIADFTYDAMISKKENYEDIYKDYGD